MASVNPERFGLEDGRKSSEVVRDHIRISARELRHFESVETAVLKKITPD